MELAKKVAERIQEKVGDLAVRFRLLAFDSHEIGDLIALFGVLGEFV